MKICAQSVTTQLKEALKYSITPEGNTLPRLYECEAENEVFSRNHAHKQRFWLPIADARRTNQTNDGPDFRKVLLEMTDGTKASVGVLQVQCDGIIVDDELGSLGMIQMCFASEKDKALEDFVIKAIREAMALRFEMARRVASGRAYFTELVLVAPEANSKLLTGIGQTLRELMNNTGYLQAIGVHLWTPGYKMSCQDFRHGLPRAMAWLLPACRKWYTQVSRDRNEQFKSIYKATSKDSVANRLARFSSLSLSDFRLAGQRKLAIDPKHALHVIHGLNGTGKSTIVDAVELFLTGKVERIFGKSGNEHPSYQEVLGSRNNEQQSSQAGLAIELSSVESHRLRRETLKYKVVGNKLALDKSKQSAFYNLVQDYQAHVHASTAGAFRLQQNMSDRLTNGTIADRARTIFDSFFADCNKNHVALQQFSIKWEQSLQRLREAWPAAKNQAWLQAVLEGDQSSEAVSRLKNELSPIFETNTVWPPLGRLYGNKPQEVVEQFRVLIGSEKWHAFEASSESALPEVELVSQLNSLGAEVHRVLLTVVEISGIDDLIEKLKELLAWKTRSTGQQGTFEDYAKLVSDWLNQHIESDLVRRLHEVWETFAESGQTSSKVTEHLGAVLPKTTTQRKRLVESSIVNQLESSAESSWNQLIQFVTDERAQLPTTPKPSLKNSDYVGFDRWLTTQPPLSQVVRNAIQNDRPEAGTFQNVNFIIGGGEQKTGEALIERLNVVNYAIKQLKILELQAVPRLGDTYGALLNIYQLCVDRAALDDSTIRELDERFSPTSELSSALNEILSLMTPARWAYEEVGVQGSFTNSQPGLTLQNRGHDITHVLNTAELNTLALGLFLLCAPRVPNPINLLILDDPLQNMDELTVTTVARGLDRLLTLWRSESILPPENDAERSSKLSKSLAPLADVHVVLLLHGGSDVERFRSEIPCCIYRLPWLSPETQIARTSDGNISKSPSMSPSLSPTNLKVVPFHPTT